METEAAKRRLNMIASHFAAKDETPAIAAHIFPLNCSSSLNSVIRRRDNKVNFARQASSSQAFFMRQVSMEQFEQDISGQSRTPLISSTASSVERFQKYCDDPMFSRPLLQDCKVPELEPPRFARPSTGVTSEDNMFCSKNNTHASKPREWSPRMDIGEYGCNYVVLVELPGVSTKDIRVEVTDKSLVVKGNRSMGTMKTESCSNHGSISSAYHKREISQGPFHVLWPLPNNVNKDNVTAEIVDGLLRINIPKL